MRHVAALLALAITALAVPVRAETRRIAIVVGSNQGGRGHTALRYAELDAAKMSAVLLELGGLAASDVFLLRAPAVADVRRALDESARRVAVWHAEGRGQAIVMFYFSGHSDGEVLELPGQALPFAELRQRMTASAADVRLTIVDSCRSGALLARKGGTLGEAFDIRLADELASTGEVLIASSAADESALESSEIGASFFSHHFISGLRGAADQSGDGLVTLAEAYQYASAHTLRATSDTVVGPQHSAYDYHLAGRGDLVLTEMRRPSAVLELPHDFDRLLLIASANEQVVAEIEPHSAHRIALAAGDYRVRAWRGALTFAGKVTLSQGQEVRLASTELSPASAGGYAARKGDGGSLGDAGGETPYPVAISTASSSAASAASSPRRMMSAAAGLGTGAAEDAWLGLVRLAFDREVSTFGLDRIGVALIGGWGRAPGMRENRLGLEVTPTWWLGDARARLGLGVGLGGGVATERTDSGASHWSGMGWASLTVRGELALEHQFALLAGADVPVTVLRRDDRLAVRVLPCGWLGVARRF